MIFLLSHSQRENLLKHPMSGYRESGSEQVKQNQIQLTRTNPVNSDKVAVRIAENILDAVKWENTFLEAEKRNLKITDKH